MPSDPGIASSPLRRHLHGVDSADGVAVTGNVALMSKLSKEITGVRFVLALARTLTDASTVRRRYHLLPWTLNLSLMIVVIVVVAVSASGIAANAALEEKSWRFLASRLLSILADLAGEVVVDRVVLHCRIWLRQALHSGWGSPGRLDSRITLGERLREDFIHCQRGTFADEGTGAPGSFGGEEVFVDVGCRSRRYLTVGLRPSLVRG